MKRSFFECRTLLLMLFVFIVVGTVCSPGAVGTPQYVTNNLDNGNGSLRAAVAAVTPGETINFINVTGTITLATPILISKSLTINGPGANILTISGNFNTSLFSISSPTLPNTVALSGLTLFGGFAVGSGGGITNVLSVVTLTSCTVLSCTAKGSNIPAAPFGGAVYNTGSFTASNCLFKFNTARGLDESTSGLNPAVGGAIYNASTGAVMLTNCIFATNKAIGGGRTNNTGADGKGGALYNDGSATITNCTFQSNSAVGGYMIGSLHPGGDGIGGAIQNNNRCTVYSSTFVQNLAVGGQNRNSTGGVGEGGAIVNVSTMDIYDSTFTANTAQGGGYPYQPGDPNPGKPGNGAGGAIATIGTNNLSANNCTISGNLAVGGQNFSSGAGGAGNVFVSGSGPITLLSTIISGGAADNDPDILGAVTSQGHNLIMNPTGASGFVASDILNVDPKLGALQSNGGPTRTMALLPGSPAIDAGAKPGNLPDQRGFPRTFDMPNVPNTNGSDGTDIGAYELRPSDHADFNGDSFPDLVLQSSAAQQVALWFNKGPNVLAGAYALSGSNPIPLPPNWQIAGVGDFNGDGWPDIVLQNTANGQIAFWFTYGNNIIAGAYATFNGSPVTLPSGWQIVGVGDFNGDSLPDLALDNPATGQIALWYANGTNITAGAYVTSGGAPAVLPSGWQIVGVGDFNGDGNPDLVLDNRGIGQTAFWLMNGPNVTSGVYAMNGGSPLSLGPGYQIAGVGDYNGDGNPDLILQNLSTGELGIGYFNGANLFAATDVFTGGNPITLPAGWKVSGPR